VAGFRVVVDDNGGCSARDRAPLWRAGGGRAVREDGHEATAPDAVCSLTLRRSGRELWRGLGSQVVNGDSINAPALGIGAGLGAFTGGVGAGMTAAGVPDLPINLATGAVGGVGTVACAFWGKR
jgi:hypothetical protein